MTAATDRIKYFRCQDYSLSFWRVSILQFSSRLEVGREEKRQLLPVNEPPWFQALLILALHQSCPSKTGVLNHLLFLFLQPPFYIFLASASSALWVRWHFSIHFLSSRVGFQNYFLFHWRYLQAPIFCCLFYHIARFYLIDHNEKIKRQTLYS